MTDYSKINIDPTEFDKSAYQKALDTLENPETKCFVMAQDIVRGIVPGYHSVEPNIGWANELLERSWPETVRFSTDGQFPQGAVEVKAEGIKNRLQDALSAQSPLIHTNKPVLPEFEYWSSGERYIDGKKNVEALIYCAIEGLDNFPNLAEHVRNNRIPGFEYSPGSPVIKHFREKKHIDFSEHSSVASDYEPHSGEMSYDEREKLNNLLMNDFREVSKKAFHEKGFSEEDYRSVFGKEFAEGNNEMNSVRLAMWLMHASDHLDQYKSMDAIHEEIRNIADYERQLSDLRLSHEAKYYIDEKSVHREVENWFLSGRSDPNADSITDAWEATVKTALDGKIPEGAVEVKPGIASRSGINYADYDLNLSEYRAENLNYVVELAWCIDERKTTEEAFKEGSPLATFEFASANDRDQCQEMVERAIVDLLLTHYKNEGERFCVKNGLDFDSVFPKFDENFIDQPEMTSLRAKVLEEYKAAQNKGVSFDNLLNSIGGSAVLEVDRCITNLDLDNNFVKPLYQKSLDNLKQDHEVKYYIDEAGIRKHLSRNPVSAEGSPTPDSMLKGWSWLDSVKTAANGNIPVGAAEVKMASSNVSLDPVYRIDDLPRASAFAWCLEQKKPFIESQYTDTIDAHCPAFCFASDKDFDRCQAMIASLELDPESFNEEVYSQALQGLSLGQECKYYITQDSICDWVNNNMEPGYTTPDDAIEDYPITVKCAEDGRIPEGAIEVICNPDKLDPKFRVEDVDQAISIQLALRTKEPLSSIQKLDHTRDAFGFPSNKAYDQCQTLIDDSIKKDPPVR